MSNKSHCWHNVRSPNLSGRRGKTGTALHKAFAPAPTADALKLSKLNTRAKVPVANFFVAAVIVWSFAYLFRV